MKKVTRPWENRYRHLKLYKNDVEEIINFVHTELATDARIEIDEFILEDVRQLNEIEKETVHKLSISAGGISFRMHFGPTIAYLEIYDENDNQLRGVASRIDAILREKQGLLSLIFCGSKAWILTATLGLCTGIFLPLAFLSKVRIYSIILFMALAIAWILYFIFVRYFATHTTIIHMCYPSEKQNFFKRKKDDILVGVIISIVSLIVGILGTLLIQRINEASPKQLTSTQNDLDSHPDANDNK